MKGEIHKILVIKLRAIGDVVLATGVLPNLRDAFGEAVIHFMVEKPARDAVEGNPYLDRIVVLPPRSEGTFSKVVGVWKGFRFLKQIRGEGYDLVFDLFGNPRSALLTWMTGALNRVGFDFRGRKYAYTVRVEPRGDRVHEVTFNLDALRAVGIPVVHRSPHFPVSEKSKAYVDRWIEEYKLQDKVLVGIHPWGSWEAKRWGVEKFAALADHLVDTLGAKAVILWGPGEREYAERVRALARCPTLLAPRTSLKELGALLARCRLVIANDSGPMHISAAVGTPTMGVFGPTNSRLQGPWGTSHAVAEKVGLRCLGCNKLVCETNECMEDLTVEDVWQVVKGWVEKNRVFSAVC